MKIDNVWFKFKNINEEKKCRDSETRRLDLYQCITHTVEEIRNASAITRVEIYLLVFWVSLQYQLAYFIWHFKIITSISLSCVEFCKCPDKTESRSVAFIRNILFSQVPNEISREIERIERDRSNLRKKYAYSSRCSWNKREMLVMSLFSLLQI